MKIAIFHNFPAGGGKRTVFEQAKGLLARGHQVEAFELTNTDSSFCDLRKLKCRVAVFPFEKESFLPGFLSRLQKDYQNFFVLNHVHKKIATHINSSGFDVALIHTDLHTESPYILQYLKIPHVYHCHELLRIAYEKEYAFTESVSWPKYWYEMITRKIRKQIDRINAQSAKNIITNSEYTKKNIQMAYGRIAKICYSGVDPKVFRPIGKRTKSILFMGQKNYVGGYDFVNEIMAHIPIEMGIQLKNFGFPKGRPDTKNDLLLARSYSQALATLCVSYGEPFGLKALESMSCGTPVMATREGGYPDSIVPGINGWLFPRDPKVFAKQIIALANNPSISNRMGSNARNHVLKSWTWDRHVGQLEKILLDVAHV